MVAYVRNLVELIGLGLAVDYSLLVVHRFREELATRPGPRTTRWCAPIATAGRAVAFSGGAVAVGLGLLLVVPVPFIRSMGIAGLLIPLVSVAAALTLQPALLSLLGRAARAARARGGAFWGRHRASDHAPAAGVPRRRQPCCSRWRCPPSALQLTPGSLTGIPVVGRVRSRLRRPADALGGGLVTPTHVVIVDGGRGRRHRPAR